MNDMIRDYLDAVRATGQAVCEAVQQQIDQLGLQENIQGPALDDAEYLLSPDPMNGENALKGTWRNARGQKCGEIVFHADGTFHAEYDVVRTHPKRQQWFIEGIEAWGNASVIKAEPKLIPAIG